MLRNLEARVEAVAPVEDAAPREELRHILDLHIADQRSVWDMRPDGSYVQRQPADDMQTGCQRQLADRAAQRHRSSKRLKKRKQQTIGSRNIRPSEHV